MTAIATQKNHCDSANAIFVIATLRFYCDFCGKSLRLRSCDCESLAICDCDCVGHYRLKNEKPPKENVFGTDIPRTSGGILKVARLQSEFCTKDFFRATNFLTKNAPEFSPKFLSLCSVGQKKIPGKFPPNY